MRKLIYDYSDEATRDSGKSEVLSETASNEMLKFYTLWDSNVLLLEILKELKKLNKTGES